MKYKVLLVGKNRVVIDEFFTHLWENFESLTTSNRYEDIANHIRYFEPDVMVYCMNKESKDGINHLLYSRDRLKKNRIPLVLVGSEEDCNDFQQYGSAALVLVKPLTASAIGERLVKFLEDKAREEEEQKRAEQERLERERLEREKLEQEKGGKAARRHVLVVDDDPLMLKVIKDHLRDQYDVATATNGRTAFKFLEKRSTDLILLDYEMPEEDGPAVLEKLRTNEATKDIAVVFLTGVMEREKIQKVLVYKPQGYLLKPIDKDKLLAEIDRILG